MIGKYSVGQIKELVEGLRKGELADKKEFRQSRALFVKQEGRLFGSLNEVSFIEGMLGLKDKIDLKKPFRFYVISAKEPINVKDVSYKDSLEFAYMTYKGFTLAHELQGEKINLVEDLLLKNRLPTNLWENSGFQLWRWETQVFDVEEDVREIV